MSGTARNDIAKAVIPAVIAMWLLSMFVFRDGVPGWVQALAGAAMGIAIAGLIAFLLLRQTGWHALARHFPAGGARPPAWRVLASAVMAPVGMEDPDYVRSRVRLVFVLRAGMDEQALYLRIPALLPPMRIPWSAMTRIRYFDASGWVAPTSEPGSFFQLAYDPGYRGKFMEIEIAEPRCFIQVPAMGRKP